MSGQYSQPALDRGSPCRSGAAARAAARAPQRGEFAERFPTDLELMSDYGVSRQTVRDAVRRLADEGLIQRERGAARPSPAHLRAGGRHAREPVRVRRGGSHEQTSATREARLCTDARVAAILGLRLLSRLSTSTASARRSRAARARSLVVAGAHRRGAARDRLARTGIYVELVARCGVKLRSGSERLRPVIPPAPDRRALGFRRIRRRCQSRV